MLRRDITDESLRAHLAGLEPDGLSLFTIGGPDGPAGGELRGALLHGSRMVNEMRANHGSGLLETFVLGQAYLAAGLLSVTVKGEDRLALRLECEGPARGFSVEVRNRPELLGASGDRAAPRAPERLPPAEVRGYLFADAIEPPTGFEELDMGPLVGAGSLTQTRFVAGAPRPVTGTVALGNGRLAEDLARFYLESEQTPTAFVLGLHFDKAGRALGAAALFLQALPGATESFLARVEDLIPGLPSLGRRFAEGAERASLLASTFGHLGLEVRGEREVAFACGCSRDKFASFLRASEGKLLEELVREGPWPVETICHNCASTYSFEKPELEAWLAESAPAEAKRGEGGAAS